MSSVLDRSGLEQSPLADLHLLANELGVDGFRRLRKPDLIDAILERQGGDGGGDESAPEPDEAPAAEAPAETEASTDTEDDGDDGRGRSRRGRRGGRGRGRHSPAEDGDGDEKPPAAADEEPTADDKLVEGVVELLGNGSGFVRL